MTSVRVPVTPKVLTWALEQAQDQEAVLAKFPSFGKWAAGVENPTLRQLEYFAEAVRVPLGFLVLDEPPVDFKRPGAGVRVRVRATGEVLNLGEFALRFCPVLVYCDIEGVFKLAFPAAGVPEDFVLLDECGNWAGIDREKYEVLSEEKEVRG